MNDRVKRCVEDTDSTDEPTAKRKKIYSTYILQNSVHKSASMLRRTILLDILHYLGTDIKPVTVVRPCNLLRHANFSDLNFANCMLDHQFTNFISPPIFLAIRYFGYTQDLLICSRIYSVKSDTGCEFIFHLLHWSMPALTTAQTNWLISWIIDNPYERKKVSNDSSTSSLEHVPETHGGPSYKKIRHISIVMS